MFQYVTLPFPQLSAKPPSSKAKTFAASTKQSLVFLSSSKHELARIYILPLEGIHLAKEVKQLKLYL